MLSARRLALLAVVGGLAAVFSAPADARPMPASYPELVTTPHFAVHFMGDLDDPIDPDATTIKSPATSLPTPSGHTRHSSTTGAIPRR